MQLLPTTAVVVAGRIRRPAPAAEDLFIPDLNISLGTAHLRYLLDLYDGDRIRALAAYNGGENAVARWNRQSGTLELDEWVENITYRETRRYVKMVLGHYLDYVELYAEPTPEL
jgi:soluble lytic murein transglycosylase